MAIFSWKSKGKKEDEKKKDGEAPPTESKPAQRPYTHVPKHAAADSLGQGARLDSAQDLERISAASQMRKQNSALDSTLADASYAQQIALNMAHGSSTPSLLNQRNRSNEAFTTHSSDYFSPSALRKLQASDPSLGYAKVAIARHDQGLVHYASDSGYESAGPSRVPSEQNLEEMPQQYISRPNGGLLPELRLNEDARSEKSFKSTTKKARFQMDLEPVASVDQKLLQTHANLAALEGYKVNKKGKVLDEEGDVIGELVEGDLLDCVRQKVNANGEVVDDIGKVVGIVKLAAAPGPALTVILPTGQTGQSADGDTNPAVAPRSPNLDTTQSLHDTPRRPSRSASERSLSELSKPYARPPMSSVPENNVPGEDNPLASPALFAYQGEIPEGPHQHMRRRSSSPPLLSPSLSARRPNPRRVSSNAMSTRSLGKQPVGHAPRRGYMSSYDNSPNGSDDGTETSNSDDGRFPSIGNMNMYKRPASIRSAGPATVPAKPRTYFTHAGRITVDVNAPNLAQTQPLKTKTTAEAAVTPAPVAAKQEKKKSRLGLFGKK